MIESDNPVIGYADSYRTMVRMADAEGRPQTVEMSSVIVDLERNIAPLFTALQGELHHAQCRASAFEAGNRAMEAKLIALQKENAELKVDKARLDFWEQAPLYYGGYAPSKSWSFFHPAGKACYGNTLREALDQLQVMHADLTKHTTKRN